jgi:hypothetical protein
MIVNRLIVASVLFLHLKLRYSAFYLIIFLNGYVYKKILLLFRSILYKFDQTIMKMCLFT